jgi:hypothetical protein
VTRLGAWLRPIATGLLLGVLALAALTARAVTDGEAEMRQSDQAFDRGDLHAATDHARRAAVLYAPGAPHVQAAYERLAAIAVGAESAGKHEIALGAWRAMRGAALETRHVLSPRSAELARANESLARLSIQDPHAVPTEDPARALERARQELERDHASAAPWIFVLVAGFLLSVLGLGVGALRGVTPEGTLAPRQARLAAALLAVGVACWTLAVLQA